MKNANLYALPLFYPHDFKIENYKKECNCYNLDFLIQHPVNGGGAPLRFSGDRLDAVRFQILFIFRTPFPWM